MGRIIDKMLNKNEKDSYEEMKPMLTITIHHGEDEDEEEPDESDDAEQGV